MVDRTTVYLFLIALVILQFCTAVQAADNSGCICDPSHFASNFSSAQQIFEGTIVTAELDDDRNLVTFSVDVDSVFRGTVETRKHLVTSLKDECRISVYVGAMSVFILGEENQTVSACDGPSEHSSSMDPFFSIAIDLVENYSVIRLSTSGDIHQELKTGVSASTIRYILTMANKLDPRPSATDSVEKLSYRGLQVRLGDDRVVSYDWR